MEEEVDDNLERAALEATEDGIEEDLVVLPTLPTPQRRAVGRTPCARPQGNAAEATEGIGGEEDLVIPQKPLIKTLKRTPFARPQGNWEVAEGVCLWWRVTAGDANNVSSRQWRTARREEKG